MEQTIGKKAIVPTLRSLCVGGTAEFPLEQMRSVNNTIYGANLCVERANGYKWSLKTDMENKRVIVTRVQ